MTQPLIQHDVSLKNRNTFGFDCTTKALADVRTDAELLEALEYAETRRLEVLLLGGGSNVVFAGDWPGMVVSPRGNSLRIEAVDRQASPPPPVALDKRDPAGRNRPTGKPAADVRVSAGKSAADVHVSVGKPAPVVHVTAGAGMVWDDLVRQMAAEDYRGIENLALIPGTVGAAPVQNIGAYGVELEHCFVSLRAWHRPSREWMTLSRGDCRFAYRDSLFKQHPDEYVITEVTLELDRRRPLELGYRALADVAHQLPDSPSALDVAELVSAIRRSKLPDPKVIGNAGSFFRNPVVPREHYERLITAHPEMVGYPLADGSVKLAAGWLIEHLGFKGMSRGAVGVHPRQALVLTHRGGGQAEELLFLADDIAMHVRKHFDVRLEMEPRRIRGQRDRAGSEDS